MSHSEQEIFPAINQKRISKNEKCAFPRTDPIHATAAIWTIAGSRSSHNFGMKPCAAAPPTMRIAIRLQMMILTMILMKLLKQ
jgi:hypothetical protein